MLSKLLLFKKFIVSLNMSDYSLQKLAVIAGKFLKLIGYGTFSLIDSKIQVTVYDFTCLTFNVCIACLVFYFSLWYGAGHLSKTSILMSLGVAITMNGGSLVTIISLISVFHNRHRIWKVILMLDEVSVKFRKIQVRANFT